MSGTLLAPSISATTLSGGTIFSGDVELSTILGNLSLQQVTNYGNTTSNNIIIENAFDTIPKERKIIFRELGDSSSNDFSIGQSTEYMFGLSGEFLSKQGALVFLTGLPIIDDVSAMSGATGIHWFANTTNLAAKVGFDFYSDISNTTYGAGQTFRSMLNGVGFDTTIVNDKVNDGHIIVSLPNTNGVLALRSDITSTYLQDGNNTYTGGTTSNPTVNVVGSPTFSGTVTANALTATTLSGGTIFSGDVDVSTIISNLSVSGGPSTYLQDGNNTYTGGTSGNPTVNVVGSPTFSGIVSTNELSATTLSASTINSGSTDLAQIFAGIAEPVYIDYTGGSVATTSTTLRYVEPSASVYIPEPGFYHFRMFGTYSVNATGTGAFFSLSGDVSNTHFDCDIGYTTAVGDRGQNQFGSYGGGTIVASSLFTVGNTILLNGYIQATSTGHLNLMFATEVNTSTSVTLNSLKGFLRRQH